MAESKLTVGMDLTQSTPYFTFTDLTNYTITGITAKGTLRITLNGDTSNYHYNNLEDWVTPDIDSSNGTTRAETISIAIPLPLINSKLVEGTYKFDYNVEYNGSGVTNDFSTITMDIKYNRVTGVLNSKVNLLPTEPTLAVTDNTNYEVDLVTPTVVRALSLVPPALTSLPLSTTTTTGSTLSIGTFSTAVWYGELISEVTYDFSTKLDSSVTISASNSYDTFTLNLLDKVVKVIQILVEGSTQLCEIYCCLSEWEERLSNARTSNPTQYQYLLNKSGELSYYLSLTQQSYACSITTNINSYVEQIKRITNCNGNCGCEDGTPILITGTATTNSALGNKIKFTTTTPTTQYQNLNLKGKNFNGTQADFLVFVDGLQDEGTFNSTLYTYGFQNSVSTGVQIIFIFLK